MKRPGELAQTDWQAGNGDVSVRAGIAQTACGLAKMQGHRGKKLVAIRTLFVEVEGLAEFEQQRMLRSGIGGESKLEA